MHLIVVMSLVIANRWTRHIEVIFAKAGLKGSFGDGSCYQKGKY